MHQFDRTLSSRQSIPVLLLSFHCICDLLNQIFESNGFFNVLKKYSYGNYSGNKKLNDIEKVRSLFIHYGTFSMTVDFKLEVT